MTKLTPNEPGLPPRRPWATYLFRGLLVGALLLLAIWLLFRLVLATSMVGQP